MAQKLPKHQLCVMRSNCFSHFLAGYWFGFRKWYQKMKQESLFGTSSGLNGTRNLDDLPGYVATDPALVWQAHLLAELGEARILPEFCKERMGLDSERPNVSLSCSVERLEGLVYLAESSVNVDLREGQRSLSLEAF